jgi:hypothetical protein
MKTEHRKKLTASKHRRTPEHRLYKVFDGETYVIRELPVRKKAYRLP